MTGLLRGLAPGLVLAAGLLLGAAAPAAEDGWAWPLELPRRLSGSFGEDRGGRFHMGIDLRTGGATGKKVLAAGDGHVSRVRCSAWGYGRALYLQLDSGHTVIYGHLSEYHEELAAEVRAKQHAAARYAVDLTFPPDRFPVRRGQVIARSGDTGSGPAHLHFEVRDAANRAVNPATLGLTWEDATPPRPAKLLVCPAGPDSRVNGAPAPAVFPLEKDASGRYACPPVRVRGPVGLGLEYTDPEPDGPRLGAHRARLAVGGEERHAVQYDALSYSHYRHNAVMYHPYLGDLGRFLLLWRWPDNLSGCVLPVPGDGWVDVGEEAREAVVELADFMGNRAEIAVPLLPADGGESPAPERAENREVGQVSARSLGAWLSLEARFPSPEPEAPLLESEGADGARQTPFLRTGPAVFHLGWAPAADGAHRLRVTHPRLKAFALAPHRVSRGGALTLPLEGGGRLVIPRGALFGTTLVWAAGGMAVAPEGAPFAEAPRLVLPAPAGAPDPRRAGIVRVTDKGRRWMGGRAAGGSVEAPVDALGAFAVDEDTTAPRLQGFAPEEGAVTQTRRPRVVATVSDAGSGVAAWSLHCGDQWLLSAYDADDGRVVWERDEDLPAGPQTLTLRVEDGAGNRAEFAQSVVVGGR